MKKLQSNFHLVLFAIIIGATIYKHFDIETFSFRETWLDYLYIITFIGLIYVIFKKK